MITDLVIAKLDTARMALAEAKTIQETKKILDIASAAEIYAKRQQLGEEAIRYATAIKVEALAQLGRMLKTGQENGIVRDRGRYPKTTKQEVLEIRDLGLDHKTSKLAQDIASLPDEQIEKIKTGIVSLYKVHKEIQHQKLIEERQKIAKAGESIEPDKRWYVYQGDIRTWQAPRQYDFIITDPPYPKEYLYLWEVLAQRSLEWLKPGGLLIAMSGQSYLDEIYNLLGAYLDYYWTAAYLTLGQPTPLRQINVNTTWKPLLIYTNGKYTGKIFGDVFRSEANDKEYHQWGQSITGMYSIISSICLAGQYILDPFCGSGTTGIAALQHGCLFDGLDLEEEAVNISKWRLNDTATQRR